MLDRTSPPITPAAGGLRPADHPPVISGLIGVLLVNLGTPDATDYWSMSEDRRSRMLEAVRTASFANDSAEP